MGFRDPFLCRMTMSSHPCPGPSLNLSRCGECLYATKPTPVHTYVVCLAIQNLLFSNWLFRQFGSPNTSIGPLSVLVRISRCQYIHGSTSPIRRLLTIIHDLQIVFTCIRWHTHLPPLVSRLALCQRYPRRCWELLHDGRP